MCAIPSDTFFLTFLRVRAAAVFCDGCCAIRRFPSLSLRHGWLVQRDLLALLRALASASVRPRALAAHRQAFAMAHTAVAAEIHQPLDAHRHFATQIAFDGELCDVLAE